MFAGADYFTIVGTNLQTAAVFDRETTASYEIEIKGTDSAVPANQSQTKPCPQIRATPS